MTTVSTTTPLARAIGNAVFDLHEIFFRAIAAGRKNVARALLSEPDFKADELLDKLAATGKPDDMQNLLAFADRGMLDIPRARDQAYKGLSQKLLTRMNAATPPQPQQEQVAIDTIGTFQRVLQLLLDYEKQHPEP